MNKRIFETNIQKLNGLINKISWIRPILCMIHTEHDFLSQLPLICKCLAVNQKYSPVLKAIASLCTKDEVLSSLLPALMFETSYLNFQSVMDIFEQFCFKGSWIRSTVFLVDIFRFMPTTDMLQIIKRYIRSNTRTYDGAEDYIFSSTLDTGNLDFIFAVWKDLKLKDQDVMRDKITKKLCMLNHLPLIHEISTTLRPLNRMQFYNSIILCAADLNKFDLFQSFYDLTVINDKDDLFHAAIAGGSLEIVKFCIERWKKLPVLDAFVMGKAYASGNVSLIKLLKQHNLIHNQDKDLKHVAEHYFDMLSGNKVTMNVALLEELLNVYNDRFDLEHAIVSLLHQDFIQHCNITEDVFRVFAQFDPSLQINLSAYDGYWHAERMIWCLKHFKQTFVPMYVFTENQLLDLMSILEPTQFPCKPYPKEPNIEAMVANSIDTKRIVYLFFAKETDLRDNAELILEYMI